MGTSVDTKAQEIVLVMEFMNHCSLESYLLQKDNRPSS
jgi:hypothetical protein